MTKDTNSTKTWANIIQILENLNSHLHSNGIFFSNPRHRKRTKTTDLFDWSQ